MKIAIVCYENNNLECWDPESIHTGIPGSEEAVIYLSKELINLEHEVTIYADPPENTKHTISNKGYGKWSSIAYYYLTADFFDIIILWRRTDIGFARQRGKRVYIWYHDVFPSNPTPDKKMKYVNSPDGIFLLSEFHKTNFEEMFQEEVPIEIIGNAIEKSQFQNPKSYTNKYSIGYFSNYSRGLEILIDLWPEIKEKYPQAELTVCYGRNTWGDNRDLIKKLSEKFEEYGVKETGMIGHQQLADIMQNTSIWAYPLNNFSETFCITAVKAQAAGMIPVVNKITALSEVISEDAPSFSTLNFNMISKIFKGKLFDVMDNVDFYFEERDKYIEKGLSYSWDNVAKKILNLDEQIKEE